MTPRNRFMLATALATGLLIAMPLAFSQKAPDGATVPTDPGFNPDTGQINPGTEHPAPTQSTANIQIPTPEETRAALLEPASKDPSAGAAPVGGQQGGAATTGQGGGGQGGAISGGPTQQQSGNEPRSSSAPNSASGSAPSSTSTDAGGFSPNGPIGSVGETIPAKQSHRNDVLDRTPIMAWPQQLSDEQRTRIFKAAMADKTQPAADADKLMPASELSTDQALNGLHPLPSSLGDIAAATKLKYVKGKDSVLLVEPSTRIVVEQIKS